MESNLSIDQIISPEARAELRRLELYTKRQISSDTVGNYQSAFRGSGLIFSDLREYQPGDDVKHIHWKATARATRPYVKTFHEDRELRVILAIDVSSSTLVGAPRSRHARALEFAALISLLAQKSNDQVGLCLFSEKVHTYYRPSSKRSQFQRIVLRLLGEHKISHKTDLAKSLEYINSHEKRPALIFLISDFISTDYMHELKVLCAKHDVIGTLLTDDLDSVLPDCGLVEYRDPESGRQGVFDTSSDRGRRALKELNDNRVRALKSSLQHNGGDFLNLSTSPMHDLSQLMQRRVRAIR